MSDIIQWARLDDPSPAVAALDWPDASYMYLERVPATWLVEAERQDGLRLEKLAAAPFQEWERGRVFCQAFELRWEKLDGAFQIVYVGPDTALPGFTPAALDLSHAKLEPHAYFMWGSRVPVDRLDEVGAQAQPGLELFIEFQTPRLLRYPVPSQAGRVKLQVVEYHDPASGCRLYYRFCGLEEA